MGRSTAKGRYDATEIKTQAAGNWRHILASVGRIDSGLLDGRHHPCPRCGGNDRFRLVDESAGAVLCNQCFRDSNGDGISAIQWLLGCDFGDALEAIGQFLGMAPKSGRKLKTIPKPADALALRPWVPVLAKLWCDTKPGVTPEAILAAGGGLSRYHDTPVISVPIFGAKLLAGEPVGYVVWDSSGAPLPVWEKKDQPPELVKMKTVEGSQPGLIGRDGIECLDGAEVVWKVEGPTDLLALWSIIPPDLRSRHVVLTNANGSRETPPAWVLKLLAGKRVCVLHDADKPGQEGAEKWAGAIAREAELCRNVQLPFRVEATHGPDLRDWINLGGTYAALIEIARGCQPVNSSPDPIENGIEVEGGVAPLDMTSILGRINRATEGWPRRVNDVLFVHEGDTVTWLEGAPALVGYLGTKTRRPPRFHRQVGCHTKDEVYREIQRTATSYRAVETWPHEPMFPDHYYACEAIEPGDGGHLGELLGMFAPSTEIDRDLILAAFATLIWGGPGGTRPLFTATSDHGRGAGKSTLMHLLGELVGGVLKLSAREDADTIKSRLLSPEGMRSRMALLDNVKTMKFSWAELEDLVTTYSISGKRMYHGEGSRPNTLTWAITMNGLSLSPDLAQRAVIIKLDKAAYSGDWERTAREFVVRHRREIIGDLVAFLRSEPVTLTGHSRWAMWENAILARLSDPRETQRLIRERQSQANTEADEAEVIEEFFRAELESYLYDVERQKIFIPTKIAREWMVKATGEQHSVVAVGRILAQRIREGALASLEVNADHRKGKGVVWVGEMTFEQDPVNCDLEEKMTRRRSDDWKNRNMF